jgi:hypothetical protein
MNPFHTVTEKHLLELAPPGALQHSVIVVAHGLGHDTIEVPLRLFAGGQPLSRRLALVSQTIANHFGFTHSEATKKNLRTALVHGVLFSAVNGWERLIVGIQAATRPYACAVTVSPPHESGQCGCVIVSAKDRASSFDFHQVVSPISPPAISRLLYRADLTFPLLHNTVLPGGWDA